MKPPSILGVAGCVLAFSPLLIACGGPIGAGVGVGKIGGGLHADARAVPAGAEVCALQDALASQGGGAEKPPTDACAKAVKADGVWRKALVALAAYGDTLQTLSTTDGASAGPLEAALTGVRGPESIEADGPEQAARDAVVKLVSVLAESTGKGDPAKLVTSASPSVKTLCEGLGGFLDGQARALADLQREIDKKRASRTDRRCAQLDGRSVCVGESVLDRAQYAEIFGRLGNLEDNNLGTRDRVASFCAAHRKLESAAADGKLSKDGTYTDIVEAVKAVPRSAPSAASKPAAPPPPAKK